MVVKETKSGQNYDIIVPAREVGNVKLICPVCSKTHSPGKQSNKDLSWNLQNKVGNCKRCGVSFYKPTMRSDIKRVYVKPKVKFDTLINNNVANFFESRNISRETILKNNLVASGNEYVNGYDQMVIHFNYWRNGELINVKYRDKSKHFKLCKDAELIFYNIDSIIQEKLAIITEGEIDCLSLIECGFSNVVSVPNGAGASMDFIENCIDDFVTAEKIILATDQDDAGYKLRDELARRFGVERCFKVDFKDCKDANEYLMKYGINELRLVIDNYEPFPIEGVFTSVDVRDELENLYLNGLQRGEEIGIIEFDKLITWQAGRVYTVTGIPGHGKSEFIDFVLTRLNVFKGWKVGYFSPENWPIELHISKVIEKIIGKTCSSQFMKKSDFDQAVKYISDNFFFIMPEEDYTIDSILARGSGLVSRKGINVMVIDPYNRLEHKIPTGMSETHYISSFYDKLGNFAKKKNIVVILVAHPTKMRKNKDSGLYEVPNLYDISGSANFYNKTDFGLTVYRDMEKQEVVVLVQKVKFKHLGSPGQSVWRYNFINGRFEINTGMSIIEDKDNYFLERDALNAPPPPTEIEINFTPDMAPF